MDYATIFIERKDNPCDQLSVNMAAIPLFRTHALVWPRKYSIQKFTCT